MDEREFVENRQSSRQRLTLILQHCDAGGLKHLTREELRELGPLYRRAASDLAYARAHAVSASLVAHLNRLVAQSYALLYQTTRPRGRGGLRHFLAVEFPTTFRRRLPFFLAAVAITLVGAFAAYFLVARSQANLDLFVPPGSEMRASLDKWATGKVAENTPTGTSALFSSMLMHNNIRVSFTAFAVGILGGVITVYILFQNGALLGAFAGVMTHVHQHGNFWPGILPHGIVELSAIFISSAAGLSLGWALLAPGAYRRRDALVLAARDTVKLVLGTVVLLIFAGIVEGFLSHAVLPKALKVGFGITSGIVLYSYLFLSGRRTALEGND